MSNIAIGLKEMIPVYAADTKLNIQNVLSVDGSPQLTENQRIGTALSAAYAAKNPMVVKGISGDAAGVLSAAELEACKKAAVIMAMNNVYYRFLHLVEDAEYRQLPARLRMSVIANPGIPKIDFEIYCLAVSIINGCGLCIKAHAEQMIKAGMSKEAVQSVARIASVVNSVSQALDIESAGS